MQNTTDISINTFDPVTYIENLMTDIGFDEASEEEKKRMYEGLSEQLSHLILNSIALYVEPEEIDEAIMQSGNLKELGEFIEKLIDVSPEAQMAILEAIDRFYIDTVETYEHFKEL